MAALLEAARAVLENRAFVDAARAVLRACRTILGAEAGLVALHAAGGTGFEVAILEPGALAIDPADGLPRPLRPLSTRAAKGRTVLANHLAPRKVKSPPPGRGSVLQSALLAPMIIADDVAGFLALFNKPGGFSAADSKLAEVFAEMAAVAMLESHTRNRVEKNRSALERKVREGTTQLRALSRRLVETQENERRHISRELHDEAAQALVSLRYGLRLLEREINQGGSGGGRVTELVQQTDAVIDGLHRLAANLRPASLDHLGLEAALRQYLRSAGSKSDLTVRFKARGFAGKRLPAAVETALYRVVQEAVTNVVRHARATRVDVLAECRDGRVNLMVEDDGVGFDPDEVRRGEHLGLLGLQERADALGGTMTLESAPGKGTAVVVEVPIVDSNSDR